MKELMIIKPCPKCGRNPKINRFYDANRIPKCSIKCPNLCSVVKDNHLTYFALIYKGNFDDNALYRKWNQIIDFYKRG